jgi:hypothetical protein
VDKTETSSGTDSDLHQATVFLSVMVLVEGWSDEGGVLPVHVFSGCEDAL